MQKKKYNPHLTLGKKITTSIYKIMRIEKRINIQLQTTLFTSNPTYKTNNQLIKLHKNLYNSYVN